MSFIGVLDRLDGRYDGKVFGARVPGYSGKWNAYQAGFAQGNHMGSFGAPVYGGGFGSFGGVPAYGGFGSFATRPIAPISGYGSFGGVPSYRGMTPVGMTPSWRGPALGGYGSFY